MRKRFLSTCKTSRNLVSKDEIISAMSVIQSSPLVQRTPLQTLSLPSLTKPITVKLESLQNAGSFKIRGMVNVFHHNETEIRKNGAVTMSAGNAGVSFSTLCGQLGVSSVVVMPETVPQSRVEKVEALGSKVECVPSTQLRERVMAHEQEGKILIHPFDNAQLIAGHATVGVEMMEDMEDSDCDFDAVLVCCGGGGLVAGVAAAYARYGSSAKVYAVEPQGAPGMHSSFELGRPAYVPDDFQIDTMAHGLAPPFAGQITYEHCREFVEHVILVSEEELRLGVRVMYEKGFVVEPSGCAGIAAILANKIQGDRIACVVTGRNVSASEMMNIVES